MAEFTIYWNGEPFAESKLRDWEQYLKANGASVPLEQLHVATTWYSITFKTKYLWDGLEGIVDLERWMGSYSHHSSSQRQGFRILVNNVRIERFLLERLKYWDRNLIRAITDLKRGRGRRPNPQMAQVRRFLEELRAEMKPTRQTARRR